MEDGEWQLCDVERFPGATVVVPSVEKSNEGIQLNLVLVIE